MSYFNDIMRYTHNHHQLYFNSARNANANTNTTMNNIYHAAASLFCSFKWRLEYKRIEKYGIQSLLSTAVEHGKKQTKQMA